MCRRKEEFCRLNSLRASGVHLDPSHCLQSRHPARTQASNTMRYTTEPGDATDVPQKFTFNPKEGIDNPALMISDDPEPDLCPRLCPLKREEGQGFGFYLRKESGCRGHVVQQVAPWSAAERSGLRDGDRILEVNEDFVDNQEYSRVVMKVQASGLQLCLLVLSAAEYETAVCEGIDLMALTRAHRGEGCARPRLCHISREPGIGLGLSIIPIEGERGKYYLSPVREGPAERAGVQPGDHLLFINGVMVSKLTHSALMKMFKKSGEYVTILVIDSRSEESYMRRRLPILPAFASTHNLPHRPKTLHLTQGPQGYGFLLRQEKLTTGHIAHLLREVDPCSPAEAAGMEDGDLLLAVNGEQVENLEHEDIVSRIRQSGQQVTLTTISIQGRDYYTQLGLSPLMFYEECIPQRERFPTNTLPSNNLQCPRLCTLLREDTGFGFKLACSQDECRVYVGQVEAGRAGERAGLREGDVIVEVNGQNVEHVHFEEVVTLIKKGGTSLMLLVVDKDGFEKLRTSGVPITADVSLHSTQVPDSTQDNFV
ncbi:Na(+)/H(+) exchange regulatory cofactor NHE-RF3 [Pangasianodon hypophthalmus]|uniref:Na(+)/H(+) exchange regulatory cofactor NHE-RF3 n=1 Tax=Pangasianodon hypophthalmus TaxID=310915 RepID=UPI002308004A|nr:Na(+)/H(+) exchange regulatory cofactor NHE-RF3 [Pangasianodon hypophthalmus]